MKEFKAICFKEEITKIGQSLTYNEQKTALKEVIQKLSDQGFTLKNIYFMLSVYTAGYENIHRDSHFFLRPSKLRDDAAYEENIYDKMRSDFIKAAPDKDYFNYVVNNCDTLARKYVKRTTADFEQIIERIEQGISNINELENPAADAPEEISSSAPAAKGFRLSELNSYHREELNIYPHIRNGHMEPCRKIVSVFNEEKGETQKYPLTSTQLLQAIKDLHTSLTDLEAEVIAQDIWAVGYPINGWSMVDELDYCALFRGDYKDKFIEARKYQLEELTKLIRQANDNRNSIHKRK